MAAPSLSWVPDRNVLSGGVVAVASWAIIAVADHYGLDVPVTVQAFIPMVLGYVVTYLLPPSVRDVVSRVNDDIVRLAAADPNNPTSERTMVLPEATKVVAASVPAPTVATPPAMGPPPVVKTPEAEAQAKA
jgi:hypothetical protein